MCGIVGILGTEPVADDIVDSLRRLEYRGYDSAGVATLEEGKLTRVRAEGKLKNLAGKLAVQSLSGHAGIGHTRWATHGAPTERNAHPHQAGNGAGRVAVVHNGIIENFRELRDALTAKGAHFETETDTEVVAHAVAAKMDEGHSPQDAVRAVLPTLEGAFGLAFLFEDHPDLMVAARKGSPLAVGHGEAKGAMYIGSDAIALSPFTNEITYLEEGDVAFISRNGLTVEDENGAAVDRPKQMSEARAYVIDKGHHRHFMAKEIAEQPEVVGHTLARYIDLTKNRMALPESPVDLASINRLTMTACGTAFLAGMTAKYWCERFARIPVDIDVASEFRYREIPLSPGGMSVFISQSGETADTLASLRYCKQGAQTIASIVNVPESSIARESDVLLPTLAGPEVSVASTKAFTCQLAVLACLSIGLGRAKGVLSEDDEERLVTALIEAPRLMNDVMALGQQIEDVCREVLLHASHALFLGRGTNYPLAMEGALKLKEISYIHAEGYAAGELKHGPIALVDKDMPVIVIAPYDRVFEKTVSNMEEVAARGGKIILITDQKGADAVSLDAVSKIVMPDMPATITPLVYAVPLQLMAYHTAVMRGTDVDQPRNLAKSVTVE
ncbi:MAG: glutamine--fructose-6-phosphate transaminase (isomerizing) [Rhizobiales bacterium]|nr:glutamine--fructose-6-phosphate transaminase (isomerizing) [Hyphomicrobiales bacterium]MBO6698365.1 glutamine--fructose-6-phosphate transaminase (isomerizing) [Hyphomicrobiales bacterium]MBO6735381.1 glutamine--fructose-6-phosphate transaminase (isomerizing) [Hyphomicrobiales bacterium]MBO6910811.1 glutamine--fructose-6-phosphate transaminase (isomerizing) [Hyphomicrobiales bacterium]MBO6957249.1 glutamine--fructose-6-phosphate transaminase (isomerizing) [Hyphomicrobiales bacterium]